MMEGIMLLIMGHDEENDWTQGNWLNMICIYGESQMYKTKNPKTIVFIKNTMDKIPHFLQVFESELASLL